MEKVLGISGLFFRSKNAEALAEWYRTHLGIGEPPYGLWSQEAGPTVLAPFVETTDYFGRNSPQWMVNFRVRDMDAMIAQLSAAGIAVETRAEWDAPEVGRFARIHDPDGNPVELWQPA